MSYQEQAIQLVYRNSDGQLEISQLAKNFLNSLKDNQLGALSIIGPYRTGKSFLVNQLFLNEEKNKFQTDPSINTCTKGLWMWNKLFQSESGKNFIVIDSEGFGSLDQHENADNKILLLNLLISSALIFNTVGPIEEKSLNLLFNVLKIVKQLQMQVTNEQNLSQHLPYFLWALRDFSLTLEDQMGEPINSKQYLENVLEEQKGLSETTMQKNLVRKTFKHFFPERDCVTIVRPFEEESQLQNIEQIPLDQYRLEFSQDISKLQKKLLKKIKTKVFNNRNITGSSFLFLLEKFVNAINKSQTPNLISIQQQFTDHLNSEIQEKSKYILYKGCKSILYSTLKINDHKQLVSQEESQMLIKEAKRKIKEICENEKIQNDNIMKDFEKYVQIFTEQNAKLYENEFIAKVQKLLLQMKNITIQGKNDIINQWEQIKNEIILQYGEINYIILDQKSKFLEISYQQYFEQMKKQWKSKHDINLIQQNKELQQIQNQKSETVQILEKQLHEKECLLLQQKEFTNDLNQKLKKQSQEFEDRQLQYEQQIKLLTSKIECMKEFQDYARLDNELRDIKVEFEIMEAKNLQKREMFNQEIQFLKNEKIQLLDSNSNLKILNQEIQERLREKDIIVIQQLNTISQLENEVRFLNEKARITDEKLKETISLYQSQLNALKIGTDKKMKEIKQNAEELNEVVIIKKVEQWDRDKQIYESQLSFLKQQLQDSKQINEQLLQALNLGRTQNASQIEMQFQNQYELMESNKQLLQLIKQQENKIKEFQDKINSLKIFKNIVKSSSGFNCKQCMIYCDIDNYQNHLNVCSIGAYPFGEASRSQIRQNQLNKSMEKSGILSNAVENSNKKQRSANKLSLLSYSHHQSKSLGQNDCSRLNKSLILNNSYLKTSSGTHQKCNTSINLANTSQQSIDEQDICNFVSNSRLLKDRRNLKKPRPYSPLNQIFEGQYTPSSTKNFLQTKQSLNNVYQTPQSYQNQQSQNKMIFEDHNQQQQNSMMTFENRSNCNQNNQQNISKQQQSLLQKQELDKNQNAQYHNKNLIQVNNQINNQNQIQNNNQNLILDSNSVGQQNIHQNFILDKSNQQIQEINDQIQFQQDQIYCILNHGDVSIDVLQTLISQDENGKPFTLYEISVKVHKEKSNWTVFKRYKDFNELHQKLQIYFAKSNNIPIQDRNKFSEVTFTNALSSLNQDLQNQDTDNSMCNNSNGILEKRVQNIQQYIHALIQIHSISNSSIFQEFFHFSNITQLSQGLDQNNTYTSQQIIQDNQNLNNSYFISLSVYQSHFDEKNISTNKMNDKSNLIPKGQESNRSLSLSQSPIMQEKSVLAMNEQENLDLCNQNQNRCNIQNNIQRKTLDCLYQINNDLNKQQQYDQNNNLQNNKIIKDSFKNNIGGKENIGYGIRQERNQSLGCVNTKNMIQTNQQQFFNKQMPNKLTLSSLNYNNKKQNKNILKAGIIQKNELLQQRNLSIDCNLNNVEMCQHNLQQNTNKSLKSEIQERIKKNCKISAQAFLKKQ